jgi:hypothetical protein
MINLCAPAIIYLIFSITQILIDTFKGLYNTAFMKVIVTGMVTLLLNILCERGLSVVSWIFVFIPFILMTVVVSMVLYVFGLDAATGNLKKCDGNNSKTKSCGKGVTIDALGNTIIYDPRYNPVTKPIYYKSPNIIVPNDNNIVNYHKYNKQQQIMPQQIMPTPHGSSSPAYQS